MSIQGLTNQSITLKTKSAMPNVYGEYTYTSSTIKARVSLRQKVVVNQNGEDVTSYAYAITATEVDYNDKLVLSDGKEREVINVNKVPDRLGNFHHSEVWV